MKNQPEKLESVPGSKKKFFGSGAGGPRSKKSMPRAQIWTNETLIEIIVDGLTRQRWPDEAIQGYIAAQLECGVLRKGTPHWQRDALALTFLIPLDRSELMDQAQNKRPRAEAK